MRMFIVTVVLAALAAGRIRAADFRDPRVKTSARRGLDYLAREQRQQGYLEANGGQYRVAMTALAGVSWLAEGSTPSQGRYAKNIQKAVDYLIDMSQPNGLIGFSSDYHYTYGHGFSMLFLSQVYGEESEEEGNERRLDLRSVLTNAVSFSVAAQTSRGGWGYVSAKDGNDFDEGSTCITQVQGPASLPQRGDSRSQKCDRPCEEVHSRLHDRQWRRSIQHSRWR